MADHNGTDLWRFIDAEGGVPITEYDRGFSAGLDAALKHVEALGYHEGRLVPAYRDLYQHEEA